MSDGQAVVFVIDDDLSMQRSLDTLLRSVGLEARLFSSAQEFMRADLHRGNVMRKMLARSVTELVRMADRLGPSVRARSGSEIAPPPYT